MQEDDSIPAFLKLAHDGTDHFFGPVQGKITGVDVGGKDRYVPFGEIRENARRMLQVGKTEERCNIGASTASCTALFPSSISCFAFSKSLA